MWNYEKRLQFPVNIKEPNAKLAQFIISQYGGPDGELGASMRYLSQRYTMPYREVAGLLTDIATEELAHFEMIGMRDFAGFDIPFDLPLLVYFPSCIRIIHVTGFMLPALAFGTVIIRHCRDGCQGGRRQDNTGHGRNISSADHLNFFLKKTFANGHLT